MGIGRGLFDVSTHSRPKEEGVVSPPDHSGRGSRRFNTQPPEGGWAIRSVLGGTRELFQHTAARRRLAVQQKRFGHV